MIIATGPKIEPKETDLLVQFEIDNLPAEYREYYAIKRNNFFATIQRYPEIWKYYILLDKIWLREFNDLKTSPGPLRMFPLLLYYNAHAKIRVGIELAFSHCMAEGRSILRDAIEFVAHAHTMVGDTELQKTWLRKNDGEAALEAFKEAFERHKKEGVFRGQEELHETWGQLSETGSHANLNAICDRFTQVTSANEMEFRLNYCGVEPRIWEMSVFSMLLACFTMEQTMFRDYESRLKLDDGLMRMRGEFEVHKERVREELKARCGLKPPMGVHRPRPIIYRP